MKIKQIAISLLCVMCTLKCSSQVFYIEDQAPTALSFSQKGNLKLVALPPFSKNFNLHLGYSPLKHLYFSVGTLNYIERANTETLFLTTDGKKWTGVIGLYHWIGASKPELEKSKYKNDQGMILDVQFGYSKGNVRNNINNINNVNNDFLANLNFQNTFTRAGISYRFNFISLGLYYQFNYIQYLDGLVEGGSTYDDLFDTALKIKKDPYQYSEFLFQLKLGSKQVKFMAGAVGKFKSHFELPLSNKGTIYVGLVLEIDEIFKLIKDK